MASPVYTLDQPVPAGAVPFVLAIHPAGQEHDPVAREVVVFGAAAPDRGTIELAAGDAVRVLQDGTAAYRVLTAGGVGYLARVIRAVEVPAPPSPSRPAGAAPGALRTAGR